MLYFFLKPLVQLALKIYFRQIHISGFENIPADKPYILALNHPTAFLEPVIMAANLKKPIHFLVRGDHFNKSFYRFLLKQGNMIPVFRQKESGFGSLKYNYDTFSLCHEYLSKGKIVALFPEGRTEHEKRLRPIQRGIARIAFGTLSQFPEIEDLFILPVGVNYADALAFRTTALLHIGKPISVRPFYNDGNAPDYLHLLQEVELALKKNMVIIENVLDDQLVEFCLEMTRNLTDFPFLPVYVHRDNQLRLEQRVVSFWNEKANDSLKKEMFLKINVYASLLEKWKLEDKFIGKNNKKNWFSLVPFFTPIAFIGFLFILPVTKFADWMTNHKVKHLSFISPVRFGAGFGAFLVYFGFFCFLSIMFTPLFLFVFVLLSLMAYSFLYVNEKQSIIRAYYRFQNLDEEVKMQIITLKEEILSSFKVI
jgi:1-acyl-sn-glycerol-3-phosphate acyltransferase